MDKKKELDLLITELTQTKEIFKSAQHLLERIKKGDYGDPQSHIKNKHSPEPPLKKEGKIVEIWSALSTGLLLLTFISLIIWDRSQWFKWIILIGGVFFVLETTIRKKFVKLLLNVTIILAVISAVILVKEFWWYILIFSLIALVVLMLRENVKELRKT
jgi:hypothetical protein